MKESELSKKFTDENHFGKYFNIDREVNPVASLKRIDLVLTLKQNSDFVFGVELKNDAHKQGNGFGKWLRQAEGYSRMKFPINGVEKFIPVLIYPAISAMFIQILRNVKPIVKFPEPFKRVEFYPAFHNRLHEHHNLNGIVSEFNVGEIRQIHYRDTSEYAFIFHNKILWREHEGVNESNYKYYFK